MNEKWNVTIGGHEMVVVVVVVVGSSSWILQRAHHHTDTSFGGLMRANVYQHQHHFGRRRRLPVAAIGKPNQPITA